MAHCAIRSVIFLLRIKHNTHSQSHMRLRKKTASCMNILTRHWAGFFMEVTACDHIPVYRGSIQAPPSDPAYPTVHELVERLITEYTPPGGTYNADDYGYVILIEEANVERALGEISDSCTLLHIYWEGIMPSDGFFIAIYLANNEYGLVFVIPDAPWVDGKLRQLIENTLDPLPETGSINR